MKNVQLESHGGQALVHHVPRNRHLHRVSLPDICKPRCTEIYNTQSDLVESGKVKVGNEVVRKKARTNKGLFFAPKISHS